MLGSVTVAMERAYWPRSVAPRGELARFFQRGFLIPRQNNGHHQVPRALLEREVRDE
jgi:hypothetical protein